MLIALAVATLAAAPAPRPMVLAQALSAPLAFRDARARPTPLCKPAVGLRTSMDPALLFREQDRASAQVKKLIDLPQGEMCLLGGSEDRRPVEK